MIQSPHPRGCGLFDLVLESPERRPGQILIAVAVKMVGGLGVLEF